MASSTPLTAASVVGAQAPGVLPPTLCAHLDCSAILVPILLGVILSCMALGSLSILAGRCWQAFPCARWRSKRALVVLVLVLQCIQTGFDIARVVSIFAVNFGDLSYFLTPRIEDAAAPFVGVFLQLQTQCFFLERAFRYASAAQVPLLFKWALTCLMLACILGSAAMGCGVALEIKLLGSFVRLVPGNKSSSLYNKFVLAWLYLGAALDSLLFLVIAHQLFQARRATHGSIKSRQVRQVIKRMAVILVEAGIILVIAQASTAIIWQVEALRDTREKSSWVYLALLLLPKVYTFTYYGMLLASSSALTSRQSSRLPQPSPTSHAVCQSLHNIVQTIEYDWGKESMSNPSSSEGVSTVTGLPLDAWPHFKSASTYQAPFPEPSPSCFLESHGRAVSAVSDLYTPPASPTSFLVRSSGGLKRPTFPPVQRTPPRSLHYKASSRSRSPPTSPLHASFRPHAEVPYDITEEAEESAEGEASVPGGTSALLELLEDEDHKTLASYTFGSQQHFGSEQRGSSFIDLGSPVIPSPSSSVFGQVIYSRKGSNATAVSSSTDSDGGRKKSDGSWVRADAKGLTLGSAR